MNNAIPDLDSITRQLMSLNRPKKPKMLVVDDEPDNLDLLYRTFRREFNVLKAESGVHALQLLATEGEVAVIISDQRMPEMKGTEFLSKTVPEFPDTVRIILTGFTDVEDLVDAINSGQVYKYITKPWDPNELKGVVQRAAETYDLLKQRTEELDRAQAQTNLLATIVTVAQESSNVADTLSPIATAFGESFATDGCILQLVEENNLTTAKAEYSIDSVIVNNLEKDPIVQRAIASKNLQAWVSGTEPELAEYQATDLKAHLVVPIVYRSQVLAILSLQWKQPAKLREDELKLIHLSAQQVALALTSTRHYQ
ncbi:response regulator receiver modulated GAF sensor protein [Crinalium epipsammum PCC 9333]|uniref:Response regulator receiver modulated GAF sensor protein n=1 Tax=Crinalium epipsammum PCC 9333 TaxID=1173022 RepID=K9W368_9CYAN|nr:response regulator [Crinalium epipsammum]AFZ14641.1 response regulator receiver modulated GAF sensor protein [Crinalium epipsammum PCC 9333]